LVDKSHPLRTRQIKDRRHKINILRKREGGKERRKEIYKRKKKH
jgi:hypothetical protein